MQGLLLIAAGMLGAVLYHELVIWRQRRCDACRVEAGGGTRVLIPHTCSRRRALYRHKKGHVTEFGERRGKS